MELLPCNWLRFLTLVQRVERATSESAKLALNLGSEGMDCEVPRFLAVPRESELRIIRLRVGSRDPEVRG